jgi:hypothetical protein
VTLRNPKAGPVWLAAQQQSIDKLNKPQPLIYTHHLTPIIPLITPQHTTSRVFQSSHHAWLSGTLLIRDIILNFGLQNFKHHCDKLPVWLSARRQHGPVQVAHSGRSVAAYIHSKRCR